MTLHSQRWTLRRSLGVAVVFGVLSTFVAAITHASPPAARFVERTDVAFYSSAQSRVVANEPLEVTSEPLETDFSITALALTWAQVPDAGVPALAVRFRDAAGAWSAWQDVVPDDDAPASPSGRAATLVFPDGDSHAAQYRLVIEPGARSVAGGFVELTAIDGRGRETPLTKLRAALDRVGQSFIAHAAGSVSVIPRSAWGADESLRFNADGSERWEREYIQPSTFILHHTAGPSGLPDQASAMEVINSIYIYHAKALGWGDIGYNYLVDQLGNVYEGRAGSDGVVGGHTYRDANCPSKGAVANLNKGSIGVALLGNYQSTDTPTSSAVAAIEGLIAAKGRTLGIAPTGTSLFDSNPVEPNVITHRDVDCTTCPGDRLFINLDAIRLEAQAQYDQLTPPGGATVVGQSDTAVTLDAGATRELWVDVRNDSETTWTNEPASSPILVTTIPSSLRHASWLSETAVVRLSTLEVPPGGTGRFVATIQAPADRLSDQLEFHVQQGVARLTSAPSVVSVTIDNLPYAAAWRTTTIPAAMYRSSLRTVRVQFSNTGTATWNPGDVLLKTWYDGGAVSLFEHASWPDSFGYFRMDEATVAPGGVATFTLKERAPFEPAVYRQAFTLLQSNFHEVPGAETNILTRVDAQYSAKVQGDSLPAAMGRRWTRTVIVRVQNTGTRTWTKSAVLELQSSSGRTGALTYRTWPSATKLRAHFSQARVRPGEVATFTFRIQAPTTPGRYTETFQLRPSASAPVMDSGRWSEVIRIDRI